MLPVSYGSTLFLFFCLFLVDAQEDAYILISHLFGVAMDNFMVNRIA